MIDESRQGESSGTGRRRLIEAAGQLFSSNGLSEVTVAQILDQSGLKAPTLYHHFAGKEGLYVAWVSISLGRISAELGASRASALSVHAFLTEACKALTSPSSPDIVQVLRDRSWLADPESIEYIDDALETSVFEPIAKAIELQAPGVDCLAAAHLFVHMVGARRAPYRRANVPDPIGADELVKVFLAGVLPASSRTGTEAQSVDSQFK